MRYDSSMTLNENYDLMVEQTSKQLTDDQKKIKAKVCGHNSWESYRDSDYNCIPTNLTDKTAIRNFQEWYLKEKEKAKPDSNGLYRTKLCSKPCTKGQAVDGVFGNNTIKLWNEHFYEYKSLIYKLTPNANLPIKINFDEFEAESKKNEIFKNIDQTTKDYLTKVFRFTTQNPSGWNYVDPIPKAIKNISKLAKFKESDAPFYKGWNLSPNIFPTPRKYTQDELKILYSVTGGDKLYKEKLKQKAVEDAKLQSRFDSYDKSTVKSDRLGYDTYVGQSGLTKKQEDIKSYEETWKGKLEPYKNKIYDGAIEWNKNFDKVNKELQTKCSRPIKFCSTVNVNGVSQQTSNCVYLSYSDICKNAGGIWVYNPGENDAWCGCRSMNDPELSNTNSTGCSMVEFKGPSGPISACITFGGMLPYMTPGTGGKDVKAREETHNLLGTIELVLTGAAFIGGPLAPLFFGAAALVGMADGVKYYQEGDKHMGTMMMALSLLGVGEVATAFKTVKNGIKAAEVVSQLGEDGVKKLAKNALSGNYKLTAIENYNLRLIKDSVYHSQKILGKEMSQKMFENFAKNIVPVAKQQKWGWKEFAKIFYSFEEKSPTFNGILVYIGGVPYTIDQIYLALYGNDNDRQRSIIGNLFDYLNNTPGEKEKALNEAWLQFQTKLVVEPATQQAFEETFKKVKGQLGDKLDFSKVMSNEEVIEKARKEGNIEGGYNEERFNKILADRVVAEKEAKEKEGCSKLSELLKLGWVEIEKIKYGQELNKNTPEEILKKIECNGFKYLLNKDKTYLERLYPRNMKGQTPTQKTILDNPNL